MSELQRRSVTAEKPALIERRYNQSRQDSNQSNQSKVVPNHF